MKGGLRVQMQYAIVTAFIALDFVTGLINALKNKAFNSSVMREGLYHKSGSLLCMLLGVLIDYGQTILDLGFTAPVGIAICTYIVLMEIGSIFENVGKINPEILPDKIKEHFTKLK